MLPSNVQHEAQKTLKRLLPRAEKELTVSVSADPQGWQEFIERLNKHFPSLFNLYLGLLAGAMISFSIWRICSLASRARGLRAGLTCVNWTKPGNRIRFGSNPTRCWAESAMLIFLPVTSKV